MDEDVKWFTTAVAHDNETKAETWFKAVLKSAASTEVSDLRSFTEELKKDTDLDSQDVTRFEDATKDYSDYAYGAVTKLKEGKHNADELLSEYKEETGRRRAAAEQPAAVVEQRRRDEGGGFDWVLRDGQEVPEEGWGVLDEGGGFYWVNRDGNWVPASADFATVRQDQAGSLYYLVYRNGDWVRDTRFVPPAGTAAPAPAPDAPVAAAVAPAADTAQAAAEGEAEAAQDILADDIVKPVMAELRAMFPEDSDQELLELISDVLPQALESHQLSPTG
ncbi:hypothetical protein ACTG9Q_14860 [Actinokineospora sp. 24-640]